MIVKNELVSYQSYILGYIIKKRNFIDKIFINNKRKLKKIIHDNIYNTIIDKKLLYDFIYTYFFESKLHFDNVVPHIRNNIRCLCLFHEDTDLMVTVSEKVDVNTITVRYKNNNENVPIVITLNNEFIYKGSTDKNKYLIENINELLQTTIYSFLCCQIEIAYEEEKRGILKCLK